MGAGIPLLRAFARWGWLVLWIGLVLAAGVWAREPTTRREVLFEAPIRIVPGTSVTGAFLPEHRGPFAIELRFREAWSKPLSEAPPEDEGALKALGKDIGGGWRERGPPGFTASYAVRTGGALVAAGTTGDRFEGFFGRREVGVSIAWIDDGRPVPHEFDVHIDRAVDGLGRWDARLVVAAAGDWISYASLEADVRSAIAVIVALVGCISLFLLGRLVNRVQSG